MISSGALQATTGEVQYGSIFNICYWKDFMTTILIMNKQCKFTKSLEPMLLM